MPGQADPIRLPRQSEALYLLQRVRDESHRFAIDYHRNLRDKRMTTNSVLEGVTGLGPTRRKRLVKELGGVKAVKEATLDELQELSWLPKSVAEAVYKSIHDPPIRSGAGRSAVARYVPVGERRALGVQRRLVAGRLHRRRRPRVRRADPPDGGRCPGRGARRVLDVGTGEGQVARLARARGADVVVGVDPTRAQIEEAHRRGGGPAYARSGAAALPFARASFDAAVACLVFEHIADLDDAIGEVARVLVPGGRFALFLNHPLLQTPNSGWIDDQVLDPPEQYWRIGPYLVEDTTVEEVEKGVYIPFIHRPLSRYLNALSDAGLVLRRMEEPAPPGGFLARATEYQEAASIPRLLVLLTEKAR